MTSLISLKTNNISFMPYFKYYDLSFFVVNSASKEEYFNILPDKSLITDIMLNLEDNNITFILNNEFIEIQANNLKLRGEK